jgi:hypothetical protein
MRATVWTIFGRGGGAGGVTADSPYRDVRPKKIKNHAGRRGVFIEIGGFPNITPPEASSRQKKTRNFQVCPISLLYWDMNTDFKPLENEPIVIEKAEDALRQGKLEECRRLAAPIFHHYCVHNHPLSPAMERLFGVYVAISRGYVEAREILCDAQP